jgi:hypothetical protein
MLVGGMPHMHWCQHMCMRKVIRPGARTRSGLLTRAWLTDSDTAHADTRRSFGSFTKLCRMMNNTSSMAADSARCSTAFPDVLCQSVLRLVLRALSLQQLAAVACVCCSLKQAVRQLLSTERVRGVAFGQLAGDGFQEMATATGVACTATESGYSWVPPRPDGTVCTRNMTKCLASWAVFHTLPHLTVIDLR